METTEAVNRYREIGRRFSTSTWLEPKDIAGHAESVANAFRSGETRYGRHFEYAPRGLQNRLDALLEYRRDVLHGSDPLIALLREDVSRGIAFIRGLQSGEDQVYAQAQVDLNGLPTPELLDTAWAAVRSDVPSASLMGEGTVTSIALLDRIELVLKNFGLNDWTVVGESNMSAKASVNGVKKRVRVRNGEKFSARTADRLIAHEVGGHVLRWANSELQPEPWAVIPIGFTVATEEGLAVCREAEYDLIDPDQMRVYAARCVAVSIGAAAGIMDVITTIEPYVNLRDAVDIAIRVKRGLRDPNLPGGRTKDWAYLGGFVETNALRKQRPDDYALLCAVKWPLAHLEVIQELAAAGRLHRPLLVPSEERLKLNHSPQSGESLGTF
jgi:hypothetical protein